LKPAKSCDGSNLKECKTRCASNEAPACYRLGWFYEQGQARPHNAKKAVKLYKQACDANMAIACRALAIVYERGQIAPKSKKKMKSYNDKACSLGLDLACPTEQELRAAAWAKRKPAASSRKSGAAGSISISIGGGDK
jgi:TPR repeat protein